MNTQSIGFTNTSTETQRNECDTPPTKHTILPKDPYADLEGSEFEVSQHIEVPSFLKQMTLSPETQIDFEEIRTGNSQRFKNITDLTDRRYLKLYLKAVEDLEDDNQKIVNIKANYFSEKVIFPFLVKREQDCVALIPLGYSDQYKMGLFHRSELLGKGSNGIVWKVNALFVRTTEESSLLFKKADIAVKITTNDSGDAVQRAALIADKLKNKDHDCVVTSEILASLGNYTMNVQEFVETKLVEPGANDYYYYPHMTTDDQVKVSRDIVKGTGQLDKAGLKHFDQKTLNVLLGRDQEGRYKGRIIDIDDDLYLPSITGYTAEELNRVMPLDHLKQEFVRHNMINPYLGKVSTPTITPLYLTEETMYTALNTYRSKLFEVVQANVWTDELIALYNEMVRAVDNGVKQITCTTIIGVLLGEEILGNIYDKRSPLPGFEAIKFENICYLKFTDENQLRAALAKKLFMPDADILIEILVATLKASAKDLTPSYDEIEFALTNCLIPS